jgi:hypothetical protein
MEKHKVMGELFYKDERYRIQGCIFEVNRKPGSGFPEAVYQEAMEIELTKAPIPFEALVSGRSCMFWRNSGGIKGGRQNYQRS